MNARGPQTPETAIPATDETQILRPNDFEEKSNPLPPAPPENDDIIKARNIGFTWARLEEEGSYLGKAVSGIPAYVFISDSAEADTLSTFIGTSFAVFVSGVWMIIRKRLPAKFNNALNTAFINPWSRRFKTSYVFGQKCGEVIGDFIPFPTHFPGATLTQQIVSKVLGYTIGLLFGVCGIFLPGTLTDKAARFFKLGNDSWTKYGKAGLVYGGSVGSAIGGALGTWVLPGVGTFAGAAIGGSIGGVAGFVAATVAVPLFNLVKNTFFKGNKTGTKAERAIAFLANLFGEYKVNYIRMGLTGGSSVGGLVGALLGSFLFPGLGALAGSVIGSAIGGMIGGALGGILGPVLFKKFGSTKAANTYDYGYRTGAMFLNPPTNMATNQLLLDKVPDVGNAIPNTCSIVFGMAGAARELYHGKKLSDQGGQDKDWILPWTQRAATGVMIGSAIGALIGLLAFPPLGAVIGSGVGGALGGLIGIAAEPVAKKVGALYRKFFPSAPPKQEVQVPPPTQTTSVAPAKKTIVTCNPDLRSKLSSEKVITTSSATLFASRASKQILTEEVVIKEADAKLLSPHRSLQQAPEVFFVKDIESTSHASLATSHQPLVQSDGRRLVQDITYNKFSDRFFSRGHLKQCASELLEEEVMDDGCFALPGVTVSI